MKKILIVIVILLTLSSIGCCQYDFSVATENEAINYEIVFCENEISTKINKEFNANVIKYLYDFTNEINYIFCFDEVLDYYAIVNRNSGIIMERSCGNIFSGYIEKKCYYAGVSNYFYEEDDVLYSFINNFSIKKEDALLYFSEYSKKLMSDSYTDSIFKNKNEIKEYAKNYLVDKKTTIIPCGASNRNRTVTIDNAFYSFITLANNCYNNDDSDWESCRVEGREIGFNTFYRYNGAEYNDTIFPININGTCGIVAATMLLQYYERMRKVNTVANSIYNNSILSLSRWNNYNRNDIVSENLHSAIANCHANGGSSSTYVSVKNAINQYFSNNNITGISATSSASWWGLKSAIDNDDPCIIFVGLCSLYYTNEDLISYTEEYINEGHAMFTYGYTYNSLNIVDEYICHAGWRSTDYIYSATYVAKTAIAGNVRLLY